MKPLLRNEQGQTMAEYTVVIAVISLGVLAAIAALSTNVGSTITRIAGYIFP